MTEREQVELQVPAQLLADVEPPGERAAPVAAERVHHLTQRDEALALVTVAASGPQGVLKASVAEELVKQEAPGVEVVELPPGQPPTEQPQPLAAAVLQARVVPAV
ncbi:MAG: hypothetical protein AAF441_10860 [Pseudomonadota bacterium]